MNSDTIMQQRYNRTFETWDRLALAYEKKFMDLDLYDDTYDQFCSMLPCNNSSVLEVGCGPGNISRYLLQKCPGIRLLGTDISPSMVKRARKNIPQARFAVMDCRDISKLTDVYDGVMCGFCLPYLADADTGKFITDCGTLVRAGGALYISVIEGTESGYQFSGDGKHATYVYEHQETTLLTYLGSAGFRPAYTVRKHYKKADGADSVHLIMIAVRA